MFPVNFLYLRPSRIKWVVDGGLERNPQNSVLIPWFEAKFADFGQNSRVVDLQSRIPLYFSLLFSFSLSSRADSFGVAKLHGPIHPILQSSVVKRVCAVLLIAPWYADRHGPDSRTL